ncbi:serine/threonine-protein kinase [Nocardia sp. NPDC051832]|uniref:serine/threonine-protein kinase n=1 Tax=Nocardia sp. NPDC051832 TaxID=3155673 RepID=UPI00343A164C
MAVAEGMDFAGYRLEAHLGTGGMGTVFRAQHPRLPRKDALKILAEERSGDSAFRARFLREAEVAARLHHPNLVAVRDRGQHDGRLWIAMQYVDGVDLAGLIRRGPGRMPIERVLRIVAEVAKGLDAIHRAGLLHRDVKPANILVEEQSGRQDRVLVTDFGIARPADDTATLAAGLTATLAYAAPEQISGGPVDQRADIYALGCVLYELLTGTVPFARENPAAMVYAHLHDTPPKPSDAGPAAGFDGVIATALAKRPDDRFASCAALAAAARAAAESTVRLGAAAPAPRPRAGRRRLLIGAALLAIVLTGVTTAVALGREQTVPRGPTATAVGPQTAVDAVSWGAYTYVAQAFPELLPASQFGIGYQEIYGCRPMNEERRELPIDVFVEVGRVHCLGNREPAVTVDLVCNADRSPIAPPPIFDRAEGDESWTRPSGAGNLHWGVYLGYERVVTGYLRVYFDDPNRNFCYIVVTGGASGAELRSRWWTEAPL